MATTDKPRYIRLLRVASVPHHGRGAQYGREPIAATSTPPNPTLPALGPAVADRGPSSWLRRLAPDAAALVGLIFVAVYATWPMARYGGSRVAGWSDSLESVWIFGWGAHALAHQPLHLFDANIFFPEGSTLAYAENLLGASLPLAPLFWVTGNPILLYTVAMILLLALGGFGVYLLVRELRGSRGPAFVAGAAFASAPYRVVRALGHPHVVGTYLTPFVLLLLLRLRLRPSRRLVVGLGFTVALQWWTSLTGGVITMLAVAVWGLWEGARLRRRAWPLLWRAGVGVGLGLALSLPVLLPYAALRHHHPDFSHDPAEAVLYSARPQSYLSPAPTSGPLRPVYAALSRRFSDPAAAYEKTLFPGIWLACGFVGALAAAAVALVRRQERGGWLEPLGLLLAIGLVGFVLSLGPHYGATLSGANMPFAALQAVLPGGLLRVPARISVLVQMSVAGAAALALDRTPTRVRRGLVITSLMALGLELAPPRVNLVEAPVITTAHRALAHRPGAVLALPTAEMASDRQFVPGGTDRENVHLYLSTAHFRPLTNGYAAYFPPAYFEMVRAAGTLPSSPGFETLRRRGVSTVIVQTELLGGTRWVGVEERLAAWPGVRVLARSSGVVVFDVSRASAGMAP